MVPPPPPEPEYGFKILSILGPTYCVGVLIGCLILAPSCIAIWMTEKRRISKGWRFAKKTDCMMYVAGGAMYFGIITCVSLHRAVHPSLPIVTGVLLPFWPTLILRPRMWIEKLRSTLGKISFNGPDRSESQERVLAAKTKKPQQSRKPTYKDDNSPDENSTKS
jgi:hypothetical protein